MKKQLQGISLILFGILLMLFCVLDPWIPIVDDILNNTLFLWGGLVSGIIGLFFVFTDKVDK